MSLQQIRRQRKIDDENSDRWVSDYKYNLRVLNPSVSSSKLNALVPRRVQERYNERARRRARRLGTTLAYNPGAELNLPIPARNIHSNNSAKWASIIAEQELKRDPYMQSNRLDSLIANRVQAEYVARERRRRQRQLERDYSTRKKPKSVKPKSVKQKARFGFGRLFGR
jgi:hypothetical protein